MSLVADHGTGCAAAQPGHGCRMKHLRARCAVGPDGSPRPSALPRSRLNHSLGGGPPRTRRKHQYGASRASRRTVGRTLALQG
eukprot:scaffold11391_cov125-Isochrysis_galbana.AAC.6